MNTTFSASILSVSGVLFPAGRSPDPAAFQTVRAVFPDLAVSARSSNSCCEGTHRTGRADPAAHRSEAATLIRHSPHGHTGHRPGIRRLFERSADAARKAAHQAFCCREGYVITELGIHERLYVFFIAPPG